MKKILSIFLTIFCMTCFIGHVFAAKAFENGTVISKGVMVMAYPAKTISTANLNEGDYVYFINPTDLWIYEVNVLPKNTFFRGWVEMLKMPVKGVNGAMVIKISEVILPNGAVKRMTATVTKEGGKRQLGGDLTPPASYNLKIHPREGMYWKRAGVLQYVPSGEYEMGIHYTLTTNEPVYIIMDEDYDSLAPEISREGIK